MPKGGAITAAVVALGVSMVTMAALDRASAQQAETELPGITVEGGGAKKKSAAKKATAPAPAPAPTEPAASVDSEAAKLEAPYETPAAVSVVGESEIDTFGQVRIDDLLRTVSGTYTRESTNNPGIAVNIRGFEGSGRVNMTIDGARQNFRFTGHEAQGLTYVDPLLLSGIEIERGAVSTAGGAGALAGTADFRTLDVSDILKPGQQVGALTKANWGSNNLGFSEMGAAAVSNGSVGFAAAVGRSKPDDYENGDGIEVPFTDEDLLSGLFKAEFAITDEQKLKFGGVFYDNDFLSNSYYQNVNSKTYTANYSYKPVDNQWVSFKLNGYRTDLTMDYDTDSTPTTGTPPQGGSAGRVINDKGWGFDATNTSRFNLGAVYVRAEYGYEYFFDSVDSFNTRTPGSGGGVNPSGKSSLDGLFSQTTFTLGMVDLITGLRYDTFDLNGSFFAQPGNTQNIPAGLYILDKNFDRLNPKVTLALNPVKWFQPYVTYSESMRAPTIFETMAGGSHPGGGFGFEPNPFLEPEIQKGWEVGANFARGGVLTSRDQVRFKADYYRMEVENYITGCFTPSFGVFFCNNPGTSVVQGVETQGTYDAGFVFGGVTYTYTDTNLPSQINGFGATSYLPDHILTLTGGVRLLNEKLTLGARGYVTSEALVGDINVSPGDSPYIDGYELLDLFSSYEVTKDIEVGFTVTNVFDLAYTPALNTPGTGFTGDTGRGRTFLLTPRAQF